MLRRSVLRRTQWHSHHETVLRCSVREVDAVPVEALADPRAVTMRRELALEVLGVLWQQLHALTTNSTCTASHP